MTHEQGKYIVTIDRPYYPDVTYFDKRQDALDYYHKETGQENTGGENKCNVVLAKIERISHIATHY